MFQKIITDAGFTLMRTEDRDCLLKCVEALQGERDHYREMMRELVRPNADAEEHF